MSIAAAKRKRTPYRLPTLRYLGVSSILAAIQKAQSEIEVLQALDLFEAIYELTVVIPSTPGTAFGSSTTTYEPIAAANLAARKQLAIAVVTEFAKYPPAFVIASQIETIHLVRKITTPNGEAAGIALGANFYLSTNDSPVGQRFNIHHEFAHVIHNTWKQTYDQTEAAWLAQNPAGSTYGQAPASEHTLPNPPSFVRGYGRVSRKEDWADLHGARAISSYQADILVFLKTDAALRAKAQIQELALNSIHPDLGGHWYAAINR